MTRHNFVICIQSVCNHALASRLAEEFEDAEVELAERVVLGALDEEAAWSDERAHLAHDGAAASIEMQRAADAAHGQPHAVRLVAGRHLWTLPIETKLQSGKEEGISIGVAAMVALRSPAIAFGNRRRTYARSAPSK